MKNIFLTILFLAGSFHALQAQFTDKNTFTSDSSRITLYDLYHPSYTFSEIAAPANPYSEVKRIRGLPKLLVIFGADLIRGKAEEYSIYSFENSWTYPGRTMKHPETVADMDFS